MKKVFKDRENTLKALADIRTNVMAFSLRDPELTMAGLARIEELQRLSDVAYNSNMHNDLFNQASILKIWSQVHIQVKHRREAIITARYTSEELTKHYPNFEAEWLGVINEFKPVPTVDQSWVTYNDRYVYFQRIDAKVRDAIQKVHRERHVVFMASLDVKVRPIERVSRTQHAAFAHLLEHFDYYYSYSDDRSVYSAGRQQDEYIAGLARSHPHYSEMYSDLVDMYGAKLPMSVTKDKWAKLGETLPK